MHEDCGIQMQWLKKGMDDIQDEEGAETCTPLRLRMQGLRHRDTLWPQA
jgi:hypothetical protein